MRYIVISAILIFAACQNNKEVTSVTIKYVDWKRNSGPVDCALLDFSFPDMFVDSLIITEPNELQRFNTEYIKTKEQSFVLLRDSAMFNSRIESRFTFNNGDKDLICIDPLNDNINLDDDLYTINTSLHRRVTQMVYEDYSSLLKMIGE
ncbi:MAG: hypothetical protein AAFW89_08190 [Bacteroidota bacterium]